MNNTKFPQRKNTKKIGEAIAKGICDYYAVSVEEKNETKKENVFLEEFSMWILKKMHPQILFVA